MKLASLPQTEFTYPYRLLFYLFTAMALSLAILLQTAHAQPAQLSLADILIALRSKKAPMMDKNKLLGEAVKTRGITFALTPEIEKELQSTGADKELVEAIRQKSPLTKTVAAIQPKPAPAPVSTPTPPPPDFNFYQKRGEGNLAKGDLDSAVADYSKAIELNPKESMAYLNRGNSYEKKGELQKALSDYQKAADLDAGNEAAKSGLQRMQAEQAKLNPKPKDPEPVPVSEPAKPSVSSAPSGPVNIGSLKNQAVKLVMPVYSAIDRQRNIQGVVTVQITLDEEGKVVEAKAISGPPSLRSASEDAIRRTKFKPVRVGEQAVKATGFINYNFTGQ